MLLRPHANAERVQVLPVLRSRTAPLIKPLGGKMFRTKEERENLWQRDQVYFAEIAHEYLCCDVPTITQCLLCTHEPDKCKNKAEALKALANYEEWGAQPSQPSNTADAERCVICGRRPANYTNGKDALCSLHKRR